MGGQTLICISVFRSNLSKTYSCLRQYVVPAVIFAFIASMKKNTSFGLIYLQLQSLNQKVIKNVS